MGNHRRVQDGTRVSDIVRDCQVAQKVRLTTDLHAMLIHIAPTPLTAFHTLLAATRTHPVFELN